jgi:hypothetical protein
VQLVLVTATVALGGGVALAVRDIVPGVIVSAVLYSVAARIVRSRARKA